MNRTIQSLLLAASLFSATGASAALFDTIDSVEPLMVIASKKTETPDRMPAGKVTEPTKDDGATSATPETKTDSKTETPN
jgi:hypothetical protein